MDIKRNDIIDYINGNNVDDQDLELFETGTISSL